MLGKGQPMCLATFLTVIGLAVLLLSDFLPTRRFRRADDCDAQRRPAWLTDSVTGLRCLALETPITDKEPVVATTAEQVGATARLPS